MTCWPLVLANGVGYQEPTPAPNVSTTSARMMRAWPSPNSEAPAKTESGEGEYVGRCCASSGSRFLPTDYLPRTRLRPVSLPALPWATSGRPRRMTCLSGTSSWLTGRSRLTPTTHSRSALRLSPSNLQPRAPESQNVALGGTGW
jgi:hypothetical protein